MNEEYVISGLTLEFKEEYDDFPAFVRETTDPIYRALIDAFNELHQTGKTNITVRAHVDTTFFETVFEYTKSDAYILKDVINPFYEEREDYEMCTKIMKIYSELIKD